MLSSVSDPERLASRNCIITSDVNLPAILATLPDASDEADDAAERLFHHHRGVYRRRGGRVVVYGNDGIAIDRRSRLELAHVVEVSLNLGLGLRGFGICCDGYTWALVVSIPRRLMKDLVIAGLCQALHSAWMEASGIIVPADNTWANSQPNRSLPASQPHDWSRDGF